jgi:microcystin-dependent protein
MSNDHYLGEIKPFSGKSIPKDWHLCNGSLLNIQEHPDLFELLKTTYGGDGINHFALPDLRSRIPLGSSQHYPPGMQGGSETVTLHAAQLPSHRHTPACSLSSTADTEDATGAFWSAVGKTGRRYAAPTPPPVVAMSEESIRPEGGHTAHENRMPVLAMSYIISLKGNWPFPY